MNLSQLLVASLFITATLTPAARTQYVPSPSFDKVLKSPLNSNITVSYKQPPEGTCTTAFPGQKQYTGYITLPPYTLTPIQQNYSINTFFWFVEARQAPDKAPLTIWLNGGPGTSSMFSFFNKVGPCEVVQTEDGTYGTQLNAWGWDRSSNMLFVDQPNQVGFSFYAATNATLNLYTGEIYEPAVQLCSGLPKYMCLNGTFGTMGGENTTSWATTANTTEIAAQGVWHFLQAWLSSFPQYNPAIQPSVSGASGVSNGSVGVNLFTESYGGKYGPVFASFFEQQNQALFDGVLPGNSTLAIKLQTVGIVNGMIDDLVQDYYYPLFAYNNTYGIRVIDEVDELNEITEYTNNCATEIQQCRGAVASTDPEDYGDVDSTNDLCSQAQLTCQNIVNAYLVNGYYPYDIRQKYPSPDPPAAYQEYLNYPSVLSAIGAKVNFTQSNPYVLEGFLATGDTIRGGTINDLANLLAMDVRVALIYGDADYICNWYGGQAVSFAIANMLPNYPLSSGGSSSPPSYASGFTTAGYADIVVNSTYVGGASRQYGNLSFSRIYQAGHFVSHFQPETAFTVFTRIIQGTDLSTGHAIDLSDFTSKGPANATYRNSTAYSPSQTCWIRAWNQSCGAVEKKGMMAGKGVVANGIYYLSSSKTSPPAGSSIAISVGEPGHPVSTVPGSSITLTGVYTATGTPKQSPSTASFLGCPRTFRLEALSVLVVPFCFLLGILTLLT